MRARLGPWGREAGERGHLRPALGTRGFPGARPAHVHPRLPRVSVSPSEQWVVTAASGPWQAAQCTVPWGPGTRVGAGQGWQPELRAGDQLSNKSSECFDRWKVLEVAEEKTSPWAHLAWLGRPRRCSRPGPPGLTGEEGCAGGRGEDGAGPCPYPRPRCGHWFSLEWNPWARQAQTPGAPSWSREWGCCSRPPGALFREPGVSRSVLLPQLCPTLRAHLPRASSDDPTGLQGLPRALPQLTLANSAPPSLPPPLSTSGPATCSHPHTQGWASVCAPPVLLAELHPPTSWAAPALLPHDREPPRPGLLPVEGPSPALRRVRPSTEPRGGAAGGLFLS